MIFSSVFVKSLSFHHFLSLQRPDSSIKLKKRRLRNCDATVSSASRSPLISPSLPFLSVYPASYSSAHPPSLYLLPHSSIQLSLLRLSSISFISFASFMPFSNLSFCLFLFVLQSNCQALPSPSFIFHSSPRSALCFFYLFIFF